MDCLNYSLDDLKLVNGKIVLRNTPKQQPKIIVVIDNDKCDPMRYLINLWASKINLIVKVNKSLDMILQMRNYIYKANCILFLYQKIMETDLLSFRTLFPLHDVKMRSLEVNYPPDQIYHNLHKLEKYIYIDYRHRRSYRELKQYHDDTILCFKDICRFRNNIILKFREFLLDSDFQFCITHHILQNEIFDYFLQADLIDL